MLNVYTYWSAHYNEVAIIVAKTRVDANIKFRETILVGCEVDDWIIGSSMRCIENATLTTNIIQSQLK